MFSILSIRLSLIDTSWNLIFIILHYRYFKLFSVFKHIAFKKHIVAPLYARDQSQLMSENVINTVVPLAEWSERRMLRIKFLTRFGHFASLVPSHRLSRTSRIHDILTHQLTPISSVQGRNNIKYFDKVTFSFSRDIFIYRLYVLSQFFFNIFIIFYYSISRVCIIFNVTKSISFLAIKFKFSIKYMKLIEMYANM